jgi:hypothetical protein
MRSTDTHSADQSPYLETLNGEMILTSTTGSRTASGTETCEAFEKEEGVTEFHDRRTSGESLEAQGKEEQEEYRDEEYENETPVKGPSPPLITPRRETMSSELSQLNDPQPSVQDKEPQAEEEHSQPEQEVEQVSVEQAGSSDEQSYLGDDFEADEYGEEEFETL